MFKKRSVLENRPCIVNKKIIIQFLFKVFKLDLTPWKFPLQAGTCIIFCLIYVSFRPSESFIMNYLKKQYFQHCLKFINKKFVEHIHTLFINVYMYMPLMYSEL